MTAPRSRWARARSPRSPRGTTPRWSATRRACSSTSATSSSTRREAETVRVGSAGYERHRDCGEFARRLRYAGVRAAFPSLGVDPEDHRRLVRTFPRKRFRYPTVGTAPLKEWGRIVRCGQLLGSASPASAPQIASGLADLDQVPVRIADVAADLR